MNCYVNTYSVRRKRFKDIVAHIHEVGEDTIKWSSYNEPDNIQESDMYIDKLGFIFFERRGKRVYVREYSYIVDGARDILYMPYLLMDDKLICLEDANDMEYNENAKIMRKKR